jgi:hypothetical protein
MRRLWLLGAGLLIVGAVAGLSLASTGSKARRGVPIAAVQPPEEDRHEHFVVARGHYQDGEEYAVFASRDRVEAGGRAETMVCLGLEIGPSSCGSEQLTKKDRLVADEQVANCTGTVVSEGSWERSDASVSTSLIGTHTTPACTRYRHASAREPRCSPSRSQDSITPPAWLRRVPTGRSSGDTDSVLPMLSSPAEASQRAQQIRPEQAQTGDEGNEIDDDFDHVSRLPEAVSPAGWRSAPSASRSAGATSMPCSRRATVTRALDKCSRR